MENEYSPPDPASGLPPPLPEPQTAPPLSASSSIQDQASSQEPPNGLDDEPIQGQGLAYRPGVFSVWDVLSRSAATLWQNIGFTLICIVVFLVVVSGFSFIGYEIVLLLGNPDPENMNALQLAISVVLLAVCCYFYAGMYSAFVYGIYRSLQGGKAVFSEAMRYGFKRPTALLLVILLTLFTVAILTLTVILPGIWILCVLAVAVPVCVIEKCGAIDSANRSADLTKGFRWGILLLIIVIFLIMLVATVFTASILMPVAMTFQSILTVVLYCALRSVRGEFAASSG